MMTAVVLEQMGANRDQLRTLEPAQLASKTGRVPAACAARIAKALCPAGARCRCGGHAFDCHRHGAAPARPAAIPVRESPLPSVVLRVPHPDTAPWRGHRERQEGRSPGGGPREPRLPPDRGVRMPPMSSRRRCPTTNEPAALAALVAARGEDGRSRSPRPCRTSNGASGGAGIAAFPEAAADAEPMDPLDTKASVSDHCCSRRCAQIGSFTDSVQVRSSRTWRPARAPSAVPSSGSSRRLRPVTCCGRPCRPPVSTSMPSCRR